VYTREYDRPLVLPDGRTVRVRGFGATDAPLLARIFEGLSPESRGFFRPHRFSPDGAAEVVASAAGTNGVYFIVLADNDEPVGYGYLHDLQSAMPELGIAIADRWQNRGIGKQLVRFLVAVAGRMGREGVRLTVDDDNTRAIRVYEQAGFELIRKVRQMRLAFPERPAREAHESGVRASGP
jgi:RimJ/RimL family protein N-acetyltransferase